MDILLDAVIDPAKDAESFLARTLPGVTHRTGRIRAQAEAVAAS